MEEAVNVRTTISTGSKRRDEVILSVCSGTIAQAKGLPRQAPNVYELKIEKQYFKDVLKGCIMNADLHILHYVSCQPNASPWQTV